MVLRVAVVIPVYGHLRTISEVVKDVVLQTPFPILLLDDGSETPIANALYSFEVKQALESGRLRVRRFDSRSGKGIVLRFAIGELVKQGYTHMVTMAADGRIPAREIMKLVNVAKRNPWDLIVGSPRDSVFEDFRLYPLFALQNMRFVARKSEFEVEALTRLMWRRIGVHVIRIAQGRAEAEDPGSWISRGFDFFRTKLFLFAHRLVCLWLESNSPWLVAGVVGLAVFLASLTVSDVESSTDPIWHGFAGSVALGVGLGLLFAALTGLMVLYRIRQEGRRRHGRVLRETAGERILGPFLRRFGAPVARPVIYLSAAMDYLFEVELRRGLNEYYRLRGRRASRWQCLRLVYRHLFQRTLRCIDQSTRLRPQGLAHLQGLVQEERGVILSCSSIGVWRVAERLLSKQFNLRSLTPESFDFASVRTPTLELIPFMGRLAPVDMAPFLKISRLQAPTVAVFAFKGVSDGYEVYARPPSVYVPGLARPLALEALDWAREYMDLVEGFLKKYPEQWLVDFPYWSEIPPPASIESGTESESVLIEELRPIVPAPRVTFQPKPQSDLTI